MLITIRSLTLVIVSLLILAPSMSRAQKKTSQSNTYVDCYHFENAPMDTVLAAWARHFKITISKRTKSNGIPITGVFRKTEKIERLVKMLNNVESGVVFIRYKDGVIYVTGSRSEK